MTNVLCHIAGINDILKKQILENFNNDFVHIIDLDILSEKIINSCEMTRLFTVYNDLKDKKNDKYKEADKRMNQLWKSEFTKNINKYLEIHHDKKIIFIGFIHHFKSMCRKIDIPTNNKFFLKIDYTKNAKQIIENNLDQYRNEIINGKYPLKYLEINFITKKRIAIETYYKKWGYFMKTFHNISKWIKLNLEKSNLFNKIDFLWIGLKDDYNDTSKIYPYKKGMVIAYSQPWLALMSIIDISRNKLKKGYLNDKPYIKELEKDVLSKLKTDGYLYQVIPDSFSFDENGNNYKFLSSNPVNINKKIYIKNLLKKLKNSDIQIFKYEKKLYSSSKYNSTSK